MHGSSTTALSRSLVPIDPSLRWTLDSLGAVLPAQIPTLERIIFELKSEDELMEHTLHHEFVRINSAQGTEFVVIRGGRQSFGL